VTGPTQPEAQLSKIPARAAITAPAGTGSTGSRESQGSTVHLAYSDDGKLLSSVTDAGLLRVWGVADEKVILEFLIVTVRNQYLSVWDLNRKSLRSELLLGGDVVRGNPSVDSLTFSPDGRFLACGISIPCAERKTFVAVLTVAIDDRDVRFVFGHEAEGDLAGAPLGLAFSPDGKSMALGSRNAVGLLDLSTGKVRLTVRAEKRLYYNCVGYIGRVPGLLVATAHPACASVFDTNSGRQLAFLDSEEGTRAGDAVIMMAIAPSGSYLAASTFRNEVLLWDLISGKRIAQFKEGKPGAFGVSGTCLLAFSPDSRSLLTSSRGDDLSKIFVRRRESATGKLVSSFELLPSSEAKNAYHQRPGRFAPGGSTLLEIAANSEAATLQQFILAGLEPMDGWYESLVVYDTSRLLSPRAKSASQPGAIAPRPAAFSRLRGAHTGDRSSGGGNVQREPTGLGEAPGPVHDMGRAGGIVSPKTRLKTGKPIGS
jgi:WD40 repeat protein